MLSDGNRSDERIPGRHRIGRRIAATEIFRTPGSNNSGKGPANMDLICFTCNTVSSAIARERGLLASPATLGSRLHRVRGNDFFERTSRVLDRGFPS